MGRAMVNIAAVFAQLERETTAERIRDNMRRLALTGRYIGSTPPLGFRAETLEYATPTGRKKLHQLTPDEDIAFVEMLFDKYLEFQSLSKLETDLLRNACTSSRGGSPGVSALRRLLSNPVYVRADRDVYAYYTTLGTQTADPEELYDGVHGMLLYGRHDRDGGAYSPDKWTVVMAAHEGVIPSARWLLTQRILEANRSRAPRTGTSRSALLSSKIRCGSCGAAMVVTYGAASSIGPRHYYKCRDKIRSRRATCDIANLIGAEADDAILRILIDMPYDNEKAASLLKSRRLVEKRSDRQSARAAAKLVQEKEQAIRNLTLQLRENQSSAAAKYLIADIEQLDREIAGLREEKPEPATAAATTELVGFEERRLFVDSLVEKIVWDGRELCVYFR